MEMGLARLASTIKKIAREAEKRKKAQLRARSALDWLIVMREEYIKRTNSPEDFTIDGDYVKMNRNALDFSIIHQSENTRLMNPVTRKYLKSFLKGLEKNLDVI